MIRLAAILALLFQSPVLPGPGLPVSSGGSCTPPSFTNYWPVYGVTNTCNGGATCSNGLGLDKIVDPVAADNATQSTSGNRPTYTTSQVNGNPAAVYGSSSSMTLSSGLPTQGSVQFTFWAVVKPSTAGTVYPIVGGTVGGFEWRINASGHQEILNANTASIGTGSATISTTSYSSLVAQYDGSTGNWALFTCAGGSCSSDGSGTNAQSFGDQLNALGFSNGDGSFQGGIAFVGFFNTNTTSGIGTFSSCKFAI